MDLHLPTNIQNLSDYLPHKVNAEFSGENVGNVERVFSGAMGLWLMSRAMKQEGWGAKAAYVLPGIAALKRAVTGRCEIYQSIGVSSSDSPESRGQLLH